MEHIVQFGINIDDSKIKEVIEKQAYQSVIEALTKEAKKQLPKKGIYSSDIDWSYIAKEAIVGIIEGREEEIIDLAAEKLADSFKRTKAFKEKMSDKMKEILNEE